MKDTKPKSRPRPHPKLSKGPILKNNQQQKNSKKFPKRNEHSYRLITDSLSDKTFSHTHKHFYFSTSPKNAKHKPSSSPRVVIFEAYYDGTDTTPTLFANQNPHQRIILLLLLLLQCSGTPLLSFSLLSTQSDSSTCPVPFTGANPS